MQTVREVAQSQSYPACPDRSADLFSFCSVCWAFFAAPPLIRHVAEQQLSKQLDRPATIGRIALNPYTLRFEADRIHIGERGGQGDFIDISRLIVKPSWSSLFRGAPIVDEVQLDSPRFHIVRYDAQRFNFTDLIEKFASQPAKPESKPTRFSVSNIRLENGQITFDDKLLGATHVIDQWKLGIPFIATLPSKTDIFVEPLLRARVDGSPLANQPAGPNRLRRRADQEGVVAFRRARRAASDVLCADQAACDRAERQAVHRSQTQLRDVQRHAYAARGGYRRPERCGCA